MLKKKKSKKKGPRGATDKQFWQELKYLLNCVPDADVSRVSTLSAQFRYSSCDAVDR